MHAERDHLQRYVFPEIEERLRPLRRHLQIIDLRWGVDTSSIEELRTKQTTILKVCFAEIARCRPLQIVLLGERYGWIPPRDRVEAVATEAGLHLGDVDQSITALEIQFGALEPGVATRPWFYFRESLPLEGVAEEVARRYRDPPTARDDRARLESLKAAILARFPDRVRVYRATWDDERQSPRNLEAFGALVLADLWQELESVAQSAGSPGADGQRSAVAELQAFIEDLCTQVEHDPPLVDRLADLPLKNSTGRSVPAAIVVGETGSGKSTIFARLARRFAARDEVILLAHAAGISPASRSVDAMLLGWCEELAARQGQKINAADLAKSQALDTQFGQLLSGIPDGSHVVLLIDSLDQFERSARAMHLTWLMPASVWPSNVFLIATANPGLEVDVLTGRGFSPLPVPPLDRAAAAEAAVAICARYRKSLPPPVAEALLGKLRENGTPAIRNPLWMTLAVNEMLVLDADDFAQLPFGTGTPEERLIHLLKRTIEDFPAEPTGAFEHIFARVEHSYDAEFVRATLSLLCLCESGLRERDLETLVPARTEKPWSAVGFAALRRALRSHLVASGSDDAWNFRNAQGRASARARVLSSPATELTLHAQLAAHFETLPEFHPLRHDILHHWIAAQERESAARYWAYAPAEELPAAFECLQRHLGGIEGAALVAALDWPLSFLRDAVARADEKEGFVMTLMSSQRLQQFIESKGGRALGPEILGVLLEGAIKVLRQAHAERPNLPTLPRLYTLLQDLGQLYSDLREFKVAADTFEEATTLNNQIVTRRKSLRTLALERPAELPEELQNLKDPRSAAFRALDTEIDIAERDQMLGLWRLGWLRHRDGDPTSALTSFRQALTIAEYFVKKYPASELGAADYGMAQLYCGKLLCESGDHLQARQHFCAGLEQIGRIPPEESTHGLVERTIELNLCLGRSWRAEFALGEALVPWLNAIKLQWDLSRENPENQDYQRSRLDLNVEAAELLVLMHELEKAEFLYRDCIGHCVAMVSAHQGGEDVLAHFERCCESLALIHEVRGEVELARQARQQGGS